MDPKQQSPAQPPVTSQAAPPKQPAAQPSSPSSQPLTSSPANQGASAPPDPQFVSDEMLESLFPSDPSDAQTNPLTEEVEKDLVDHIITNLEESKLTVEQAQALAKEFLALLPFQDKHDLVQKLNSLSEKYDEAKAVYVKYAGPVEEEERQRKITEMANHIKAGNIEEALAVAKGGTT